MTYAFHLGVVADEISDDPERAFPAARELGLHEVELQRIWGKSVADLTAPEIERVRNLLARLGLRVSMIGTAFLKACRVDLIPGGDFAASADFARHMELLRGALVAAKAFDCRLVRTFSFRWAHMVGLGNPSPRLPRGGEIPPRALDLIRKGLRIAARVARREGLTLGLENVRSCYANTGENARVIIDAVNSPALKAVWDPANSFVSGGVDYPDGYEAIRPHMAHVHFKDARVRDEATGLTSWECIGSGQVHLREELAAFARDGYAGVVSVETHWQPEDGSNGTARTAAGLKRLLRQRRRDSSPLRERTKVRVVVTLTINGSRRAWTMHDKWK